MNAEIEECLGRLEDYLDDKKDLAELMLIQTVEELGQSDREAAISHTEHMLSVIRYIKEMAVKLSELGEGIDRIETLTCTEDENAAEVRSGLRLLRAEITESMLQNSLLTLTTAKRKGIVKIGEQFKIRLPDGSQFTTELVKPSNRLKERGEIRRFYGETNAKVRDEVLLKEVEKGVWDMSLISHSANLSTVF